MTKQELSALIDANSKQIFFDNQEVISSSISALSKAILTQHEAYEAAFSFSASIVEASVAATFKTLVDLGYLDISE